MEIPSDTSIDHEHSLGTLTEVGELFLDGTVSRIVVIFPHPDDILYAGVALQRLTDHFASDYNGTSHFITDVTLTRGEAAHDDENPDPFAREYLGMARVSEHERAYVRLLGDDSQYAGTIQFDFPDRGICGRGSSILEALINNPVINDSQNPALLVTFDELGADGHEDHEATAKIVREYAAERNLPILSVGESVSSYKIAYATPQEQIANQAALNEYHSQLGSLATVSHLTGRNHFTLETPEDLSVRAA